MSEVEGEAVRSDVDSVCVTLEQIAARLQLIADKYPAEYKALHAETLNPTSCHQHCYLDGLYGWTDQRYELEEAQNLLWLAGVGK